jgi:hypothetical protein
MIVTSVGRFLVRTLDLASCWTCALFLTSRRSWEGISPRVLTACIRGSILALPIISEAIPPVCCAFLLSLFLYPSSRFVLYFFGGRPTPPTLTIIYELDDGPSNGPRLREQSRRAQPPGFLGPASSIWPPSIRMFQRRSVWHESRRFLSSPRGRRRPISRIQ